MVLGCSCANRIPPSFVPTRPSALSGPCQTSFHCAPAAITPGIAVTVTCFSAAGCGKAPSARCCAMASPPKTRVDPTNQHAIAQTVLGCICPPDGLGREAGWLFCAPEKSLRKHWNPQQRAAAGHIEHPLVGAAETEILAAPREAPYRNGAKVLARRAE